ncbi:MAG: polyprenyl synthetase family protein [Actinomycetes bacterium]
MAVPEAAAVLEAAGPRAVALMVAAEARILELSSGHPGSIGPFAERAVAGGGKRLRPLLAVLAAGAQPADEEAVVRAAAAVELVHAATLVHDDILDGADLRRGSPTVVADGGREMAVAVGDLLFAAAFGELVTNGVDSVAVLARAGSDLARGELLQRADAWDAGITEERFLLRCRLKTARLFEAATSLGAMAGGTDPDPPTRIAAAVGTAFQLLDDVLDVTGPPERTGKPRGADLLDGTVTLPLILALKRDRSLAELDLRSLDRDSAEEVCDRIEATGALEEVRERADRLVAEAIATADTLPEPSAQAFRLVARAMVERSA